MKVNTIVGKTALTAFVAVVLCGGFLYFGVNCAGAKSCTELWEAWDQANMNYTVAFNSYFYGDPISCAIQCAGNPNPNCVSECQVVRQTTLAQAEINLITAAFDTCVPYSIPECEQALNSYDSCLLNYPYWEISDPEESMAMFTQFYACRTASKVDFCR